MKLLACLGRSFSQISNHQESILALYTNTEHYGMKDKISSFTLRRTFNLLYT